MGTKVFALWSRIEWSIGVTNFDLNGPVTPNWTGGQILNFFFCAKFSITRFVSTRKIRWCQIRCCRTNSSKVIVDNHKVWKNAYVLHVEQKKKMAKILHSWRHLTLTMLIQGHELCTRKSSYAGLPTPWVWCFQLFWEPRYQEVLYAPLLQGA